MNGDLRLNGASFEPIVPACEQQRCIAHPSLTLDAWRNSEGSYAPSGRPSATGPVLCICDMSTLIRIVGDLGEGLSRFTQRWIPDSWVVCMILTVLATLLAMFGAGAGLSETVLAWGGGMWALLELAMQFTIAMVAAHACVSSRPAYRFLDWLARRPNADRPVQAVVLLGAFAITIAYVNWAATVVASALFVPFIARRNRKADIRLLIASAYLGIGTVWHGGLSGSAPLILATPGNPLLEPATGCCQSPRRSSSRST